MDRKAAKPAQERGRVLTIAALNTAEKLGMRDKTLAQVLGVSTGTISNFRRHGAVLEEGKHPFEMAAALVRIYRSLAGIVGKDPKHLQGWFLSPNRDLKGVPAELVSKPQGLFETLAYLDTRRARI